MIKSEMLQLDVATLASEASYFAELVSVYDEPNLYGVTDGKAVGTHLEHKFTHYLAEKYKFQKGNSASGIDFPDLNVDMKVTSIRQPQSSCPFRSARQKYLDLAIIFSFLFMKKMMILLDRLGD